MHSAGSSGGHVVRARVCACVFRRQCEALPSGWGRFYIHRVYVSSPRAACSSHAVAGETLRWWPPWCARWSVCSSSCCLSERRRTHTPRWVLIRCRESGRKPSASTWVDNTDDVLHHDKSVKNNHHDVHEDVEKMTVLTPQHCWTLNLNKIRQYKLTQAVSMMTNANSTGPRRFHKPLRSSCIAMAIRSVPPKKKTWRTGEMCYHEGNLHWSTFIF